MKIDKEIIEEALKWAKEEKAKYGYYPTDKEELKDYPTKINIIKKALSNQKQEFKDAVEKFIKRLKERIFSPICDSILKTPHQIEKELYEEIDKLAEALLKEVEEEILTMDTKTGELI